MCTMGRELFKHALYRKQNTQAHGLSYYRGGQFRDGRHAKHRLRDEEDASPRSMGGKRTQGRDYTPLFRFLLDKVGCPWDAVYGEAVARLDRRDPIFWLVALRPEERQAVVRVGESSYYSGLYVDESGILQRVDPGFRAEHMQPLCDCCTYTFNGVALRRTAS
jgi:hypothetical protein